MTGADLPVWIAILIVVFALTGAALSMLGAFGLIKLSSFYDRVHAPTLGATLGMALILLASWIYFAATGERLMPRELLIAVFLTVTTPVTLILLARAALFRDRTETPEPKEKVVPQQPEPSSPRPRDETVKL